MYRGMRKGILVLIGILAVASLSAQTKNLNLNKAEREIWFTELGFGMFIHWSLDCQYGYNISHTMRLASDDYLDRYINELPKTFNPEDFDPDRWAKSAKMAGMEYMVFTTKHHNGFCMWDTQTTDFNIMNTPFQRDIVKEVIEAFRKQGIAIGLYFSPDDFWFLHQQGLPVTRDHSSAFASQNPELDAYDKRQLTELLTKYGQIDILFLDGNEVYGKKELAKVAWKINPDIVVTRGAIKTPEQHLPNTPLPSPWESCITLTNSWSFRPTNETYKSASDAILKWVEINAKGGNLLLNVGPDSDGVIPEPQLSILSEIGSWWFVNHELFDDTKPYDKVRSENGYYFLQSTDEKHLYVVVPGPVASQSWHTAFIEELQVSKSASISVLGQGEYTNEKELEDSKRMTVVNKPDGIEIEYYFINRFYNTYKVNNVWQNPAVLKISNYK